MRREGGTKAAGLGGMDTRDSIPLSRRCHLACCGTALPPSRAGRSRKLQHSVLGKQTGVRPATWGSADSWLSEARRRGQAERQAEVARCSPPELLVCWAQASGISGEGEVSVRASGRPSERPLPRALPLGTREVKREARLCLAPGLSSAFMLTVQTPLGPGRPLCRAWHLCPRTATQDAPSFEDEAELVLELGVVSRHALPRACRQQVQTKVASLCTSVLRRDHRHWDPGPFRGLSPLSWQHPESKITTGRRCLWGSEVWANTDGKDATQPSDSSRDAWQGPA